MFDTTEERSELDSSVMDTSVLNDVPPEYVDYIVNGPEREDPYITDKAVKKLKKAEKLIDGLLD